MEDITYDNIKSHKKTKSSPSPQKKDFLKNHKAERGQFEPPDFLGLNQLFMRSCYSKIDQLVIIIENYHSRYRDQLVSNQFVDISIL